MFFTKGGLCSLPRWVGRSYLQIEKRYLQFEKIKSKRKLCTIGKLKTKKWLCTIPKIKNDYVQLQMKVFQFHT